MPHPNRWSFSYAGYVACKQTILEVLVVTRLIGARQQGHAPGVCVQCQCNTKTRLLQKTGPLKAHWRGRTSYCNARLPQRHSASESTGNWQLGRVPRSRRVKRTSALSALAHGRECWRCETNHVGKVLVQCRGQERAMQVDNSPGVESAASDAAAMLRSVQRTTAARHMHAEAGRQSRLLGSRPRKPRGKGMCLRCDSRVT